MSKRTEEVMILSYVNANSRPNFGSTEASFVAGLYRPTWIPSKPPSPLPVDFDPLAL